MKEKVGLHILDALDNLNTLVDADSLEDIEVTDDSRLIGHKKEFEEESHEVYWVHAGPDDQTLLAIKNTFRSVHSYLQTFYSKMKEGGDIKRLVEGINTIMVLVGEATRNFEKFGTLFREKINDFEEIRQLQNFYRNKVIKESFREFAKTPIPKEQLKEKEVLIEESSMEDALQDLLAEEDDGVEEVAGVHILNDLNIIRKDHHYELFFLKNEAGNRFYTYELARSLKLACGFGEFSKEYFGDDPLLQIKNWEDKRLHLCAALILKTSRRLIEKFYKEALRYKEMDSVASLHNALMALMLASNPRNLIRQFSLKGCHLYFQDFLLFLREVLNNRDYQKFLIYSPPEGKTFFQDLLDLTHQLCYQLFTLPSFAEELSNGLKKITQKANVDHNRSLSEELNRAYVALTEALQKHPNGPIFKTLDIIREEEYHFFDPLLQSNFPENDYELLLQEKNIRCMRMPCPIIQDVINKAYITEEFKTFLRALNKEEKLLYVNFQDRTSWKEHARSLAIEDIAKQAEFAQSLVVVTLAKDTEFYHQIGHYQDMNEADVFIEQFLQHLNDETTGYYFSPFIKKELFPHFVDSLLKQLHETFFDSTKHLDFQERLNFIQLTYHFIELKLLEITQPSYVALSAKDGLDITATTNLGLIALLTMGRGKKWKEEEFDRLNTILFGPTLMVRERVVQPERFEPLLLMIQLLEKKGRYLDSFASFYKPETLDMKIHL